MNYILGIGLLYKKYKKNAVIKLYMDDKLLDIYDLEKDVDPITVSTTVVERFKKKFTWFNRDWFDRPDVMKLKCKIPRFLKIIEIEEEKLAEAGEFRIEVYNDDSNYTNGFMSKSSLIEPNFFILCPKELMKNNGQFFYKFQENLYKKIVSRFEKNMDKTKQNYGHFKDWSEKPRPQWPIPQYFDIVLDKNNKINKVKKNDTKLYDKYISTWLEQETKPNFVTEWLNLFKKHGTLNNPYILPYHVQFGREIGGSFHITFNINKKNKIYFLDAYNLTSGIPVVSMQTFSFAHYFSYKYEQ